MSEERHEIGDMGEPCILCGGVTVYLNEKHSMCKTFGCPLWMKPQQWYEEFEHEGETCVRMKPELQGRGGE